MPMRRARLLPLTMLTLACSLAHAQTPQAIVQRAVDSERAANQADHTSWVYLEDARKPKEHIVQWVVASQKGDVRRVFERNDQKLSDQEQREIVQKFLHDPGAQKKQQAENQHDNQQVDDFLKLLPIAFRWTETGATTADTTLHFEPDPAFRPPTREARVFSGMVGDLVIDNQQQRIRSMSGHLIHDVTFGGGLLGRLKEGSTFSLEQAQVGPSLWQLVAIHVHLDGSALLFKSVSFQEDNDRSHFELEPVAISLDEAGIVVLTKPAVSGAELTRTGMPRPELNKQAMTR